MLTQLLYTSDPVNLMTLDDLLEIQVVSMRNNARTNVTSILLHAEGKLVQFLEGERNHLLELFETIKRDDRHQHVRLLYHRPADARIFADWHMAMLDLDLHSDIERRHMRELVHHAEHPGKRNGDPPADLELLCRFRELLLTE